MTQNNCEEPAIIDKLNRARHVDLFVGYMDRHPVLASVMVLSFCAGVLILVSAVAAVLVLAVKNGSLADLLKIITTISL